MRPAGAARVLVAGILLGTGSTTGVAQWLNLPTPGMPRTADGKPHLSAPAPRALDGTPDLSGLWRPGANVDSDFMTADAQPWTLARGKDLEANVGVDSWAVLCLPPGPMINFGGGLFRIIQTPRITAIMYEVPNNFRQVFTDGRSLPKDPNPTWQGYSVGKWEGDTFVVQTIGFNDKSFVGRPAYPHTEALRVTERYRRRDFGHLEFAMIVDDAQAFTRPWTMRTEFVIAADDEMLEFVCNENEKDRQHIVAATPAASGAAAIDIDVASLPRFTGTYEVTRTNGAVTTVTIALEGDHLTLAQGGRPPAAMMPQSPTIFTTRGGVSIEFIADDRGEITQLIAHAIEGDMKGVRTGPAR